MIIFFLLLILNDYACLYNALACHIFDQKGNSHTIQDYLQKTWVLKIIYFGIIAYVDSIYILKL